MQQIWSKSMQSCRKRWHHVQTDEWVERGDHHNIPNVFLKINGGLVGGGGGRGNNTAL